MMDYLLGLLFGSFIGVCCYLMVDGYMAMREHRSRFNEETDKYLRRQ